jgi:hypothetical protein
MAMAIERTNAEFAEDRRERREREEESVTAEETGSHRGSGGFWI